MRRRPLSIEAGRQRARLPALLAGCGLLLAGCGGGSDSGERWTPGEVGETATARAASVGGTPGRPPAAGPADRSAPALQPEGEIELPEGRVERAYRVRIVNGPHALEGVVAELVGVAPGVEIVKGHIELGHLAAGVAVLPPATVTLRHAASMRVDPSSLRWRLHEHAMESDGAGRLLSGEPEQLATSALRDYRAAEPPAGTRAPQLAAVLEPQATVAGVNRALRAAQLRIAEMRPRSRALTLRFVAAADERGQKRALELLAASRAFELVRVLPARPVDAGGAAGVADGAPEPDSACDV